MKPVIGITADLIESENKGLSRQVGAKTSFHKEPAHHLYDSYLQAVSLAGGVPLMIQSYKMFYPKILDLFDGLILSGGGDIKAEYYGEKQKFKREFVFEQRIDFELRLLKECMKKKKPILAICMGMQLVNVFFKGTLYQDLSKETRGSMLHKKDKKGYAHKHIVKIFKGTLLGKIWKKRKVKVNTFHHQAVKKLGKGLKVSARSKDSLIEAVEARDYPFLLGVQWHPERDINDPFQKKLFTEFVKASKK